MSLNFSSSSPSDLPVPAGFPHFQRSRLWMRVPRFVVPRELSVYFRISCRNVPFHQLKGFARLQAQALSPFVRFGSSAVRQGAYLHLWIWDKAEEERFSQQRGGITRFTTIAQSLLSKPLRDGVVWVVSGQGVEAQLWSGNQLQDAQWFDEPPSAKAWQQRLAESPGLLARGWPQHLPAQPPATAEAQRAWARNLTPRAQPGSGFSAQRLSRQLLVLAVVSVLGWAAWLLGQKQGLENIKAQNESFQQQQLSQRGPDHASRVATLQLQQRIQSIQALHEGSSPRRVLEGVSTLLSRQGLWLRDIHIQAETVEATIVAPPGITPRLTSIVAALENEPMFREARFVDVLPGGGLKFSWRTHNTPSSLQARP